MPGTKAGGAKTAKKLKDKYGQRYYIEIGRLGGSQPHPETRYFHKHPEIAATAGAKGGSASKRTSLKRLRAEFMAGFDLGEEKTSKWRRILQRL